MCLLLMVKDEKENSSHNGSSLNALGKLLLFLASNWGFIFSLESSIQFEVSYIISIVERIRS